MTAEWDQHLPRTNKGHSPRHALGRWLLDVGQGNQRYVWQSMEDDLWSFRRRMIYDGEVRWIDQWRTDSRRHTFHSSPIRVVVVMPSIDCSYSLLNEDLRENRRVERVSKTMQCRWEDSEKIGIKFVRQLPWLLFRREFFFQFTAENHTGTLTDERKHQIYLYRFNFWVGS